MKRLLPAFTLAWLLTAHAQGVADSPVEWIRADVVRINAERARITLKHEPIESVKMDAMTMQFRVSDPAKLATVKPGDKVRFSVRNEGGELVVVDLQPAP